MSRPVHQRSAHHQRTARYNPRTPTAPTIIDTVALQDDWKPEFDEQLVEDAIAFSVRNNLRELRSPDNGSRTIEFFSIGRSSPHYFHGIKVGHTTPEAKSSPNVLPLRESPCTSPNRPRKV